MSFVYHNILIIMSSTRETLQQLVDRASIHAVTIDTERVGIARNKVIKSIVLQVGTQSQSMEDYGESSTSNLYVLQQTTRNLVGKPMTTRNELLVLQTLKLNGDSVTVLKRDDDNSVTYLVQKTGVAKRETLQADFSCPDCGQALDDHE